jgi:hypothetical protein
MLSTDFKIFRLRQASQMPLFLKWDARHFHAHSEVLVHSALRGRGERGQFMHFSLLRPVHAAHICPGVLTQTFRREVVQLRQRESERKNEASHIQSLQVRDVFVKIARSGFGQDRHATKLLCHSIASHPAA